MPRSAPTSGGEHSGAAGRPAAGLARGAAARASTACSRRGTCPTYLREEGRLAALTGDTVRAVAAHRHYRAMRPNPEPEVAPEVEAVRRRLAQLPLDRNPVIGEAPPFPAPTAGGVGAGRGHHAKDLLGRSEVAAELEPLEGSDISRLPACAGDGAEASPVEGCCRGGGLALDRDAPAVLYAGGRGHDVGGCE